MLEKFGYLQQRYDGYIVAADKVFRLVGNAAAAAFSCSTSSLSRKAGAPWLELRAAGQNNNPWCEDVFEGYGERQQRQSAAASMLQFQLSDSLPPHPYTISAK